MPRPDVWHPSNGRFPVEVYQTNFDSFKKSMMPTLRYHFDHLWHHIRYCEAEEAALFPVTALFTETSSHYVVELVGAVREYKGLSVKNRKEAAISSLLSDYPVSDSRDAPLFEVGSGVVSISNQTVIRGDQRNELLSRFPMLCHLDNPVLQHYDSDGVFLNVASDASLIIKNCVFASAFGGRARCRTVLFLAAIPHNYSIEMLEGLWRNILAEQTAQPLFGLTIVPNELEKAAIVSQFKGLFLQSSIRETTISNFLRKHPSFLRDAFGSENVIYEPKLIWMEHDGTVEEDWIQPDALVQRPDGKYNVLDFKLAGLDKKRITNRSRKRRRFVSFVEDGIAQLANYDYYFSFQKNSQYLSEKFGIMVDKPELILVVGHMENAIGQEISEALRRFGSNRYTIVDYDSLASFFLAS